MREVHSFVAGEWVAPAGRRREIIGPVDGRPVAVVGSEPPDAAAMIDWAVRRGGPALRAMGVHDRARMLKALGQYLEARKEELYALNPLTGATRRDGWPDIDGGIITLFGIASKGRREMSDADLHREGGIEILSREGTFLGRHLAVPLEGVAVHINAFNFPVWGMLEKLAPALLAGMPAIVKPATQTCYLAEAAFRMILESGLLPEGAVQFIAGGVGDLLDRLGPQDVVSFTGSAETGLALRSRPALLAAGTRFIAEQDSLNASVMGPDVTPESPEWSLFLREVVQEMTTKAGQKCTAIRRIMVPADRIERFTEQLSARLAQVPVGHPEAEGVRMGALASHAQREDVLARVARIAAEAERLTGDPEAFEVIGADPEVGAFLPPMLFRCDAPDNASAVHEVEAFGPVSTVMPYRDPDHAAELMRRGGGSLVASVITHEPGVAAALVRAAGAWHGRIYVNDRDSMKEATGHGSPLPHLVHGGPGRAGGGEELGGVRGVLHYMQRTAVQGSPRMLTAMAGEWAPGGPEIAPAQHPFRRHFDEIEIGETLWTDWREITLEDIEHFARFTGDRFYAHMDEAAAAANPFFPGRVAHGYLLLSFAAGLFVEPNPGPVLANTGLNALRFLKPVSPGDRVRVRLTARRKTRRTEEYGEVAWAVTMVNQDEEPVADYELLTMVAVRGHAIPDRLARGEGAAAG